MECTRCRNAALTAALLTAGLLLSPLAFADDTATVWPAAVNAADQQRLTTLDGEVKRLLDQLQQSEDETTRNEALNLYRIVLEDPEPLADAALTGNWKCRSVQIETEALYGYPNFNARCGKRPRACTWRRPAVRSASAAICNAWTTSGWYSSAALR